MNFFESTGSKISTLLGGILLFGGFLSLLFGGIYAMLIWWRIVGQLEYWGFMAGLILFPIAIPLSPIYLGVNGNWEPFGVFIFAMTLGFLLIMMGRRLYDFSGVDSHHR